MNMVNNPLDINNSADPDNIQGLLPRTEPSFAAVFEFNTIGMALISMGGLWMRVNSSLSAITGYSEEELVYTEITDIFLPEDTVKLPELIGQLLAGEMRTIQIEKRMKQKDGTIIWVECVVSIIRDANNEPLYYISQIRDLSSRKSDMERKLVESEQRYKSLIEHNPAGILTCDLNGLIKSVNPAMERILGFTEMDMLDQSINHFWGQKNQEHGSSDNVIWQTDNYMLQVTHKNGEMIELGLKNVPIIVNGTIEGVYIIARDITQHNKDRESLRVAQQDLHDTVRRQQGMTMKFRKMRGKFIHTLCDGELLYRLGYKPSHIIGNGLYEIWPYYMAVSIDKSYRKAWNGEENVMYEATFRGITYLTSLRPIFENGRVIEVIGSCVDITERKRMETELRETKELLESFISNTTDAICVLDPSFRVMSVNAAYEQILGWNQDELLNQPLPIYPDFLEEQRQEIYDMLKASKKISGLETVRLRKDGKLVHVSVTKTPIKNERGEIIGFAGITRDITERKRTEELLRKSDKLSVAGQLAAGLAHEIRNPLTSLRGFLQLLQNDMKGKQHYFNIMLSELDRINFIVSEFLVIAKPEAIHYKKSDLKDILQSVIALLDTQAVLCDVQLLLEFESEIPKLVCSEMHLKQLFINLVKNAMEAILKDGLIKMTVSLQRSDLIRIRTEDNGCGIPEERLKQLGEPFYTTKEKGTGLGLMMCFKIVEAHKGTMTIQSHFGEGTVIDVFLPTQPSGQEKMEMS
ncbi:two-component system, sporulation sensor kinase A [Paenibacillus sp. yr247]|uniref:PAS domain S-box protein n=1 Tax=Paenibacillus sp. yr247 TaxID=1761880 RepID=UPI0008893AFA|nr:PAS domain S-box protein [Paenibacillus sp. yr247]SDN75188.1 two-component system, sporulation sensor kinase A [Paenibacillus sp. yr247]